jgi:hypothetical protein
VDDMIAHVVILLQVANADHQFVVADLGGTLPANA